MPLSTSQDANNTSSFIDQVVPPQGWFTEDDIRNSRNGAFANNEEFIAYVNQTLPLATNRSEELMDALQQQLEMKVSAAYLTIDADAAYHVFLLISQDAFQSPHLQAGELLIEKFTSSTIDLAIRFTFTVGREHIMAHLTTDEFKLKHIRSIERGTGSKG